MLRFAEPGGTSMLYWLICPTERPTVLVISALNGMLNPFGIRLRRWIAYESVRPLPVVNWSDSGASPAAPGIGTASGICALERAGIVTGSAAGEVTQFCPHAASETGPR